MSASTAPAPAPAPADRWLKTEEAALLLGVTPKTLRNMVKRGSLKAYRLEVAYRFKKSDLEQALRPHDPEQPGELDDFIDGTTSQKAG